MQPSWLFPEGGVNAFIRFGDVEVIHGLSLDVRPGEFVVFVAGTPPGTAGSTNTLRVHKLGGE